MTTKQQHTLNYLHNYADLIALKLLGVFNQNQLDSMDCDDILNAAIDYLNLNDPELIKFKQLLQQFNEI